MPKPRSGGPKTKDSPFTSNFNLKTGKKLTQHEILDLKQKAKRAAKLEKVRLEQIHKSQRLKIAALSDRLAKVGKRIIGIDTGEKIAETIDSTNAYPADDLKAFVPTDSDIEDTSDFKSAYQMLQDMRWIYRHVHGRKRLKALVEDDDKQFVFMVKELMKIEASLMAAKVRKGEDLNQPDQRSFFVVLKGLEDEKKYLSSEMDKTIDMGQIQKAINPGLTNRNETKEREDKNQPPEQLLK